MGLLYLFKAVQKHFFNRSEQRFLKVWFLTIEVVRVLEVDVFTNACQLRKRGYRVLKM